MSQPNSARQALRSATASHHERVDQAFGRYDLSVPDHYRDFLEAQAAAFLPVEAAIDRSGGETFIPDWPKRRRSHLLLADLGALGVAADQDHDRFHLATPEETLGAVYVLEGARLGGQLLVRSVPAHLPRRFLANSDSRRWRTLIETLDTVLISHEQRAAAIDAARRVFALFEGGAGRHARTM